MIPYFINIFKINSHWVSLAPGGVDRLISRVLAHASRSRGSPEPRSDEPRGRPRDHRGARIL